MSAGHLRRCRVPTTVNGGAKKSATPEPSRRNSGHIAVPKTGRRLAESLLEHRRDELVDGPRRHGAADDDAVEVPVGASRCECLRDLLDRSAHVAQSVLPSAADGVPTQTSETSAPSTASCASVVVRRVPRDSSVVHQLVEPGFDDRAAAARRSSPPSRRRRRPR